MVSSVINTPRLDMAFVNAKGQLTEYGYVLLAGIIRRTGGAVNEPFDAEEILNQLNSLSIEPSGVDYGVQVAALQREMSLLPVHAPQPSNVAESEPGNAAIYAELDALRKRVHALEIGYQV